VVVVVVVVVVAFGLEWCWRSNFHYSSSGAIFDVWVFLVSNFTSA
jgi:hypothetical protein